MNLRFYVEKLEASEEFKQFMNENPEAFPCSGFFVIDKEGKDNKIHFDYFIPEKNEMFSLQLEDGVKKTKIDLIDKRIPEKIYLKYDFDFDKIEKLIESKMFEEKVTNKIQKILLSLQRLDNKDFLVGTVFISGLGMIKVHVDINDMKIVLFEKRSVLDMISIKKRVEESEQRS